MGPPVPRPDASRRSITRPVAVAVCAGACLASIHAPPAGAGFVNRTEEAGLVWSGFTWGAALGDVDGDGDLDIVAGHHFSPPALYWNDGLAGFDTDTHPQPWLGPIDRHGFVLVTLDLDADPEIFVTHGADGGAGAEPNELYRNDRGGSLRYLLGAGGAADAPGRARSVSAADYDGDGRVDLWVGEAPDAVSRNSLFRNDGGLFFTDRAAAAGLDESYGTVGGIWGDFDDDGDPDLLVGGEEFSRPTKLWRNDGGVFGEASASFSPALPVLSGADWGDVDGDGDLDLAATDGNLGLVDTWAERDSLVYYFNTRYGDTGLDGLTVPSEAETTWAQFRILARVDTARIFLGPAGVHPTSSDPVALTDAYVGAPAFTPGVSRGTFVWRKAAGGSWEIRCSTPSLNFDTFDGFFHESAPIRGASAIELETPIFPAGRPRVWRNDSVGFVEITSELGLEVMLNPRDISWVDYDNDGDLDLHVVDMGTSVAPNAPDRLWRNDGPGAPFVDVTAAEGVAGGTSGLGDGAVWGDLDGDLDLDLFLHEGAGPAAFNTPHAATLYVNEGPRGNALLLELLGIESGAAAIGTRVTVVAGALRVHRRLQANSWRGFQDPRLVHIGLGNAAVADSVLVEWPAGLLQVHRNVPAGSWKLVEGVNLVTSAPGGPAAPVGAGNWRLEGLAPQPARGFQRLRLELERETSIDVVVRDAAGRLVRRLHRGAAGPGTSIGWDGRDERGRPVAAGVYWIRVSDGARVDAVKSVRLR